MDCVQQSSASAYLAAAYRRCHMHVRAATTLPGDAVSVLRPTGNESSGGAARIRIT
jgi:hypothetical protein